MAASRQRAPQPTGIPSARAASAATDSDLADDAAPDTVEDPRDSSPGDTAVPVKAGAGLLTLQQIADNLAVGYARLRGFAEAPGVREMVGAVDVPGMKGVRYPREAQEAFAYLISSQNENLVTPKTAAAWMKNMRVEPVNLADGSRFGNAPAHPNESRNGTTGPNNSIATMEQLLGISGSATGGGAEATAAHLIGALMRLTDSVERSAPPAQIETWYTLAGAAKVTGLSQRTIKGNIPCVLDGTRRKYSSRDIALYQSRVTRFAPIMTVSVSDDSVGSVGGETTSEPRQIAAKPESAE